MAIAAEVAAEITELIGDGEGLAALELAAVERENTAPEVDRPALPTLYVGIDGTSVPTRAAEVVSDVTWTTPIPKQLSWDQDRLDEWPALRRGGGLGHRRCNGLRDLRLVRKRFRRTMNATTSQRWDLRRRGQGGFVSIRPVRRLSVSKPTLEGAGVRLRRAFGFGNTSDFDPFLLLDDFRNERPEDYLAGFPWHPHRGIETITYVLAGTVEHDDSMGHAGAIGAGDVQWMTAGRGILHQEMPKGDPTGRMHGFQLWANLPAAQKMIPPRYQEVKSGEIPEVTDDDGTRVRVVCGSVWGTKGPVDGIAADPTYLDVAVPAGRRATLPVETARQAFAYVFAGTGKFCNASGPLSVPTESVGWADTTPPSEAANRSLVLFDRGDEVTVQAGEDGVRFLLVSGLPLREPVAWYGPIVMNTQEQLRQAFDELENGTFIK